MNFAKTSICLVILSAGMSAPAFAHGSLDRSYDGNEPNSGMPVPVPMPPPAPYPGPAPYPAPYPGPVPVYTCYAQDAYGRQFYSTAYDSRLAQQTALNGCYQISNYGCIATGCILR